MIPPPTKTSANLENELSDKLNAPSVEDQKTKYKEDIEKGIKNRMIVMREVVVRASILSSLSGFSNSFLRRKLHDVLRSSNKR